MQQYRNYFRFIYIATCNFQVTGCKLKSIIDKLFLVQTYSKGVQNIEKPKVFNRKLEWNNDKLKYKPNYYRTFLE